jgi:hypothetical protein
VKILAVSDQVSPRLYNTRVSQEFGGVDMALSCGDLPYSYLEYIATMLSVPCLYVHGNHDGPEYLHDGRTLTEPGGWDNVDGRTVEAQGLLVGGLEGSFRYKPNAPYQYTEYEMALKILHMVPRLFWNRVHHGRYLDILITHSPSFGIHDGDDLAHRGFKAFLWFMARFCPRYLLHGHQRVSWTDTRETRYLDTRVIDVNPLQVIEW